MANAAPQPLEATLSGSGDFVFTDRDFHWLAQLANRHTGIMLPEAKRNMVYSRLARRLRHLGLTRFDQYRAHLERGDSAEFREFINSLTTNLTAFFREPHHFDHLRAEVLPELLERKGADARLTLWSAGCSTGEEPYSIAITVAETLAGERAATARVLATDLDTHVLDRARAGIYDEERVAGIPAARRHRWFQRGRGGQAGTVRVRPGLQAMLTFRQMNLIERWPVRGPFDVIFCRNVVIYFDKPTQRRIFDLFADLLIDGGYLYIGHSETLFQISDRFELLGRTMYRKQR